MYAEGRKGRKKGKKEKKKKKRIMILSECKAKRPDVRGNAERENEKLYSQ